MIVVGAQFDIAWENPGRNFDRVRILAGQGADLGAELLVLPEMFATGFSMEATRVAGHATETRLFVRNLAREFGLAVMAGMAEEEGGRFFNACSLVDARGEEILHYRKIHPFSLAGEHEQYDAGAEIVTVTLGGLRLTPFVCYDLRFPELFRLAVEGTDFFCVIANWPARRRDAWRALLVARAIENQAYVLGVNRVGEANGLEHRGDSMLLDPMGVCLAGLSQQEGLVIGHVDAGVTADARRAFSFVKDRRPDLYRTLEKK